MARPAATRKRRCPSHRTSGTTATRRRHRRSKNASASALIDPAMELFWDRKISVAQNYANLGIRTNVNKAKPLPARPFASPTAVRVTPSGQMLTADDDLAATMFNQVYEVRAGRVLERNCETGAVVRYEEVEAAPPQNQSVSQEFWTILKTDTMAAAAAVAADRKEKQLSACPSTSELAFLQTLIERHGHNLSRMACDSKLNPRQLTAAQLRRRFITAKVAPFAELL